MNQIRRAIIMAAGKGTRLRPVTLQEPKPLVKIKGRTMIETIIEALHENGIHEIHVVVGYQKEQFDVITKKYEGIHLIENPYYEAANNISSLYVARDYIGEAFIIDGDQIISNAGIFDPVFVRSGYCAAWTEETDEWLLKVQDGIVVHCKRDGGKKGYRLYGVSMWTKEDGKKLKRHLEEEFIGKHNTAIYWDDVAMFCYPKEYQLGIRLIGPDDIREVDSLSELIMLDDTYRTYEGV